LTPFVQASKKDNMKVSEMASMGGKARAKSMTKAQRSEAARKAVMVRWAKHKAKKCRKS
jgi:hypothetical protein